MERSNATKEPNGAKERKPEAETKKVTKERRNGTEGMERRKRKEWNEGKEEGNEGTEGKGTSMQGTESKERRCPVHCFM